MTLSGGSLTLAYYFPEKKAIVNSIFLLAMGIGSFAHPLLFQWLVDSFGLRGAFLLYGALGFNAVAMGMLMKPTEVERNRKHTDKQPLTEKLLLQLKILTNVEFLLYLLSLFADSICLILPVVYLPEYLVVKSGFGRQEAALAASMFGMGGVLSRMFVGVAASDTNIGEMLLYIGAHMVTGALCFLGPTLMTTHVGVYLYTCLLGVYASGIPVLIVPITFTILGVQKATTGLGIVYLIYGIGSLVGPPIASVTVARLGYDALFFISGGTAFLASVFATLCALCKPKAAAGDDVTRNSEKSVHSSRNSVGKEEDKKYGTLESMEKDVLLDNECYHGDIQISHEFEVGTFEGMILRKNDLSDAKCYHGDNNINKIKDDRAGALEATGKDVLSDTDCYNGEANVLSETDCYNGEANSNKDSDDSRSLTNAEKERLLETDSFQLENSKKPNMYSEIIPSTLRKNSDQCLFNGDNANNSMEVENITIHSIQRAVSLEDTGFHDNENKCSHRLDALMHATQKEIITKTPQS